MENPGYAMVIDQLPANEGGGWLVSYPELPGCIAAGETIAEAVADSLVHMELWLDAKREAGLSVPEPGNFSGKLLLRLPKSVHSRLAARAAVEGMSLNTLVLSMVSEALGRNA